VKKVIIFGTGTFGKRVKRHIDFEKTYEVAAFTVDAEYITENELMEIPVVPFEEIEENYSAEDYSILICVGYIDMNDGYKEVFDKVLKKGYSIESFISKYARVYSKIDGIGNIILPNAVVDFDVCMGNGNRIEINTLISHDTTIGNYNFISAQAGIAGNVVVGNNCYIGIGSIISNNISVADYTLVGAGTYINKSTQKYDVYTTENVKLPLKSMYASRLFM